MHICCLTRISLGHAVKGGMEVHVATLARGLVNCGHRVTVVTSGREDGVERETVDGVDVVYLAGTKPGRYTHEWGRASTRYLKSLHASDPIDVIWGEGAGAYYYLKWYRSPLRLPVVTFLQGTYLGELGTSWSRARLNGDWRPFLRFVLWRTVQYFRWDLWYTHGADAVIGASRNNAALARWGYFLPRRKVSASVNGVDVERFVPDRKSGERVRERLGIEVGAPVILHCSRLEAEKGAEITLRAFSRLSSEFAALRLIVAGDGILRDRLPTMADKLGVSERVFLPGHVPHEETPALYNACTVYVSPTLAVEAFGITVAEAMACGRPVIASRKGGIRDSVEHGKTGLLVPAGNSFALAEALRELLTQPERRARLGAAAREKSLRELSERKMIEDVLGVLQKVTAT